MRPITSLALVPLLFALSQVFAPHRVGSAEGCTSAWWRSHPEHWLERRDQRSYQPWETFSDVFDVPHGPTTLAQALNGSGGGGMATAQDVLARAATAALLSSAHEEVAYPLHRWDDTWSGEAIIPAVQAAWGDREAMIALADLLEDYNNLGCPL